MELDLNKVPDDDDFQCYNTSEGKPVRTNLDDELQLLPKETSLTPETFLKMNEPFDKSHLTVQQQARIQKKNRRRVSSFLKYG